MIDTHVHLNLEPLFDDYMNYYNQAQSAGVTQLIVPGVNQETSLRSITLAQTLDGVWAGVGYHPDEAEQLLTTQSTQQIYHWLQTTAASDRVVALGETGLDYYRLADEPLTQKHQKAAQKKLFKLHIKVALELNKPLLVHVRQAQEDALALLSQYQPKAVLHCFSGDADYLAECLKLGCYVSFAGNVTFANAGALVDRLRQVPLDRLLLETDAPFLNPNRGQWPNTPAHVAQIYQTVAQLLQINIDQLEQAVETNARRLLHL